MYPFYSAKKMRVYPSYRNYPFNIHVDNGVPVLPDCFNERNVLQIGTQAYPIYEPAKCACTCFTEIIHIIFI